MKTYNSTILTSVEMYGKNTNTAMLIAERIKEQTLIMHDNFMIIHLPQSIE